MAALASSVVASMPIVFPFSNPACATCRSTHPNTSWCVASSISRRVREIVTWSGVGSSRPICRNCRKHNESANSPGDASFAVDPLEEADQHQTEVHARHERRTAQLLVIKLPAAALAELVESGLVQQLVQPLIERMTRSFRQLTAIPEALLPLSMPARSHRHSRILR